MKQSRFPQYARQGRMGSSQVLWSNSSFTRQAEKDEAKSRTGGSEGSRSGSECWGKGSRKISGLQLSENSSLRQTVVNERACAHILYSGSIKGYPH